MAKKISDEVIKLSIVINGNTAQKELFDLEKATRGLNEENKALNLQKKRLEKQNKQDTEEYKTLTKTIKDNSQEIKTNKARMKELQDQVGLLGLTMSQLRGKASQLRMTLDHLIPGTEDYKRYNDELKAVSDRMAELKGKGDKAKWSIGGIADGFNRYAAIGATVIATITGIALSFQKILDFNGKLARAQTNVQKTTGMTKREVDELTKLFGLTRTEQILTNVHEIFNYSTAACKRKIKS